MTVDDLSFEEALAQLEETNEQLEKGDLTLENALVYFEKGIALVRCCESHLTKADGKLSQLLKGENGRVVEKVLGVTLQSLLSGDNGDE